MVEYLVESMVVLKVVKSVGYMVDNLVAMMEYTMVDLLAALPVVLKGYQLDYLMVESMV